MIGRVALFGDRPVPHDSGVPWSRTPEWGSQKFTHVSALIDRLLGVWK